MAIINELREILSEKDDFSRMLLISNISDRRTTKLEELTQRELHELWEQFHPEEMSLEQQNNLLKEEILKKEWKSNILALAEKTGIKDKDDWQRFNHFMFNSSRFKKHLNSHSLVELKLLYKQLKGVQMNNERSAQNPLTKAWFRKGEKFKTLN